MENKYIFSRYALIGENLDLRQNVNLEINQNGKIIDLSYEIVNKNLDLLLNDSSTLLIPGFINSHVHIGDSFAKELG
ncbi:MAG: hypothetical protein JSV62_02665, partial [Promethearchaeota archaeon]